MINSISIFTFRLLHGQRIQSICFILSNANYTTVPIDINDAVDYNLISCSVRNGIIQDRVECYSFDAESRKIHIAALK